MAKSKSGGSRSLLRGRLGNDVYNIGKDGKGKRQQVVRSLAESVSNPQTLAQMRGRMIMSTIMQASSALSHIVDHSFDGLPTGQPNISEFTRRNYELIKADVAAHPATGNSFSLNAYQEKGVKPGTWLISKGEAKAVPLAIVVFGARLDFDVTSAEEMTAGKCRELLGLGEEEYFTVVTICTDGKARMCRFHPTTTLADATVLTAANVSQMFETDGNVPFTIQLENSEGNFDIMFYPTDPGVAAIQGSSGAITTRKGLNGFIHSTCQMMAYVDTLEDETADAVLPTYPEGKQRFLNGGEI